MSATMTDAIGRALARASPDGEPKHAAATAAANIQRFRCPTTPPPKKGRAMGQIAVRDYQ
jgi:hypothetical protein